MLTQIGGRKLIALVVVLVSGILVATFGKPASVEQILHFLEIILGTYVGGNVGTKLINGKPDTTNIVETAPAVDIQPILGAVEDLRASDTTLAQNVSLIQQTLSLIIRRTGIDRMPEPPAINS